MNLLLRASALALAMAAPLTAQLPIDVDGHPVSNLAPSGTLAVVLFFTASDCPISNRYIPEIQRLDRHFKASGVQVWLVYPNPGDTAEVIRAHDFEFAISAKTVLDINQSLTRLARANTTPEAAVFIPEGSNLRQVYRGRIDDRYLSIGNERPQAMHHDLEQAIRAVLAHTPVAPPGGPTIGCSIVPIQP
jgi:hypothetical protein